MKIGPCTTILPIYRQLWCMHADTHGMGRANFEASNDRDRWVRFFGYTNQRFDHEQFLAAGHVEFSYPDGAHGTTG
jgi:hypothetical protein